MLRPNNNFSLLHVRLKVDGVKCRDGEEVKQVSMELLTTKVSRS